MLKETVLKRSKWCRFKCFIHPTAAYDADLSQSPGPGGEPGLWAVDQQFWLHRHTAHHPPRPRDQRQRSHPLPRGPALLWLPLVPACEVPQQVSNTALLRTALFSRSVFICLMLLTSCVDFSYSVFFLTSSIFGVFAGRTGTFPLQKCLPALQWNSACYPKRRPAGGLSKWPSVWKVRSTLCGQNSTILDRLTFCELHSEIRDTSVQLDLSHVNCAEEPWLHIHRQSRQSWLAML